MRISDWSSDVCSSDLHYSSAFTVLMRAAGIPARVVTGYQGGYWNKLGDYLLVRNSDAHAWSEVWLAGRGWVRVDPTGAVRPERVSLGDRKSVVSGKSVSVRVGLGGRRIIKKKKKEHKKHK